MDKREIKNVVSKYDDSFENLKIVSHFRKVYEGPNRGEGSKVAENDLLK